MRQLEDSSSPTAHRNLACALALLALTDCSDDEPADDDGAGGGGATLDAGDTSPTPDAADPVAAELAARASRPPLEASVPATSETDPIPVGDGNAIWIHPTDPASSKILGAELIGGLHLFELDGTHLQDVPVTGGGTGEVDVRYGFPLGDEEIAIVAGALAGLNLVYAYRVDPDTGTLVDVIAGDIDTTTASYGSCLYESRATGKFYLFVTSATGNIVQLELSDDGTGAVTAEPVRSITVDPAPGTDPTVEACTVDDERGWLYLAQENDRLIWRYHAEPDAGNERTLVDAVDGQPGENVEGLAIYHAGARGGYLLASVQGQWSYRVYTREVDSLDDENVYLGSFDIIDGDAADGTTSHDCLEVTNFGLGSAFPNGMLLTQDFENTAPGNAGQTNYKMVDWAEIAGALDLVVDTGWDPRE